MMISVSCKLMDLPYLLVKEESVSVTAAFYTSLYKMSQSSLHVYLLNSWVLACVKSLLKDKNRQFQKFKVKWIRVGKEYTIYKTIIFYCKENV